MCGNSFLFIFLFYIFGAQLMDKLTKNRERERGEKKKKKKEKGYELMRFFASQARMHTLYLLVYAWESPSPTPTQYISTKRKRRL